MSNSFHCDSAYTITIIVHLLHGRHDSCDMTPEQWEQRRYTEGMGLPDGNRVAGSYRGTYTDRYYKSVKGI